MVKQPNYKIAQAQLVLIVLVWMLIFALPVLFGDFATRMNWTHIFKIWKETSILLLLFLANHFFLMPQLFFKGKRILYFISITTIIVLSAIVIFKFQDVLGNPVKPPQFPPRGNIHPPPLRRPGQFIPPYANFIIMGILLIGFDSSLLFFSKWMQSEQKKIQTEKENVKNQMTFLQNQVSPHFFMNTLNNIHALVDIDTEEAKDAIIKLSRLMDYMLYESQSATISLKQEMEFVKSYVELMKLRFTDDIDLVLDIPEKLPQVNIPPLLTISFIENAFKYGISYEVPSFIHIHVKTDENKLYFMVENSKHQERKRNKNYGIGLENAKKRLELLFGNRHQLNIINKEDKFTVHLNFPL